MKKMLYIANQPPKPHNYLLLMERIKSDPFMQKPHAYDMDTQHDNWCDFLKSKDKNNMNRCNCRPRIVVTDLNEGVTKTYKWNRYKWN